ncbi:hypothetical protein M758_1G333600 [Ceratodon purpureus]|uniref:Uncharacterized protein n=1 Tax=Ceratodon purpureus TaxID=3225 RepID=A0A8T0JDV7_CERPU|nr:hypothetical protein KC19_1G339500 [Ceratodon purpureus]KAG0632515.1 hypothetical protein M758_1G333600 [Ceratodon purpureus]
MAAMACLGYPALSLPSLSRPPRPRSSLARPVIASTNVTSCALGSQPGENIPGLKPNCGNDKAIGKLESLFYTDSGIPEEKIEKPTGLPKGSRAIGNNPRCPRCKAKGAVECATCVGSGLYVDAILESQGVIVKVRCLGCGGAGNHMCLQCGGRGHV